MSPVVEMPREKVEVVADLRLPPFADQRLAELMDRNNEGRLSEIEREELRGLVEWSEKLAIVRAEALEALGRRPA